MRIALVAPYDPGPAIRDPHRAFVGGVERVYAEVSLELARRGHDVTLITSTTHAPGRADEGGVHVVRERRAATILRAPIAALARHVTRDADAVMVAGTYPFTTGRILRRAHEVGIPSILDFHFEPAPGTFVGRLGAAAYRRVGPRAFRLAQAIVVRSTSYARAAPGLRATDPDRWRIVPNGVDTGRFHAEGVRPRAPYLLFVGRLVPYKGIDVLLRALALRPVGLPLIIAGDGPLRGRLESLAQRWGVDARFYGHVSDEQLPALYRGAALTILPSVTGQEAFGLSLLESMACGTPVVASDLPGVADLAAEAGLVAAPRNEYALGSAIHAALEPARLPRGSLLSRRIHARYSWSAVVDRLLDVYREVVDARTPRLQTAHEVTTPAHLVRQPLL